MAKLASSPSTDLNILGIPAFIWKWFDGSIPGILALIWGEPANELIAFAKKMVQGANSPGGPEITEEERKYLWIAGASLYPVCDQVSDKLANTVFAGLKSDDWILREGQLAALQLMQLSGVRPMSDSDFPPAWRIINNQASPDPPAPDSPTV